MPPRIGFRWHADRRPFAPCWSPSRRILCRSHLCGDGGPLFFRLMGATETVDLFFELINDDRREDAIALFAEHAVLGVSVPGSDERTNLRGRDKVGGWFVRAGDGFRMYANDGRSMGASYIADLTVMRPGAPSMHVEANFRVEDAHIVSLFLQPL